MHAASHARPPPSRTPERRRSTSPKLRFGRGSQMLITAKQVGRNDWVEPHVGESL
ncbi:hypothetical protein CEE69_06660 [Rhodopirellula bahusiensis]|uniref:Uncharacterized protein n=1 Tax=Rhodopirellula bahusiensis TaxID=2014065 RepID=A0A2G1WA36_9BACT|nr:hypothetical protein CEE69_06660 [Rhodopirellula bahusiensis]